MNIRILQSRSLGKIVAYKTNKSPSQSIARPRQEGEKERI